MTKADLPFTIGIEEEYLLVDVESRDLIRAAPPTMLAECESLLEGQVSPEFLQCQIEVGTRVCESLDAAASDLARLRKTIAEVAARHGLAIIAASTHPFAHWSHQQQTEKDRYTLLASDMQAVARRLLICGMHVHIGVPDEDLRIDLMSQAGYILPHLLALSASSPFWEGRDTGLMSYRIAVWDGMPRTGLPEHFDSYSAYQRTVDALVKAGRIEDATKIWWDIRPSDRYPTLEMRISDVCTRLDDAICIAALYGCWLRMLYRLRLDNQRWRRYSNFLVNENRWLAQRYSFDHGLIDFGRGAIVPYADLLEEILTLVRPDAEHLGCVGQVERARDILARGTSAHRQLEAFTQAKAGGASDREALNAVVDGLIDETTHGLSV